MSGEWHVIPLRSCAKWLSGGTPSTSNASYWDGEIPWISAASLTDFRIRGSDRRITKLGAENGTRIVPAGTVLFVVRGMSLKSEFRIGIAMRDLAFGQDCKALIAHEGIDPMFLAYAIKGRTAAILSLVDEAGHGTGRLQTELLEDLAIGVPSLDEQRRIAGVLGALDEKIENNRKTASRAGELAQHEFVRWLATQADAPRVVVSELITVGALVVGDGYRAKNSEMADEGLAFIRGRNVGEDIDMQSAELLGWDGVRRAGEKRSRIGDVFFTAKGTVGRVGRVSQWSPEFVYSPQLAFWRTLNADVVHPDFLYLWICSKEFLQQRDSVKGQTDMADYVNLRDQREMKITLPDSSEQRRLAAAATPLLDTQALLQAEVKTLATIRDLLLPRLVSGQIRVPESYEPNDVLGTLAEEAGAAV